MVLKPVRAAEKLNVQQLKKKHPKVKKEHTRPIKKHAQKNITHPPEAVAAYDSCNVLITDCKLIAWNGRLFFLSSVDLFIATDMAGKDELHDKYVLAA